MDIRILLSDANRITLEGLRSLIENQPGLSVVAEAEDGPTTLGLALKLVPDVMVTDMYLPGLNGIEVARRIKAEQPKIRVLVMGNQNRASHIRNILAAGASGYLSKSCSSEEVILAIRTVGSNAIYLDRSITKGAEYLIGYSENNDHSAFSVLSSRERQVLQLLAEGNSTKEIASCLNISIKTVETHRHQVMEKLDTFNVAGLTRYAIREGLVSLEM